MNVHDFVDKQLGRAVPYGIYDLANDEGWVSVGDSADTAEFTVNSVRTWWANMGATRFPTATAPAHHGGRRRFQRLPATGLESTTGQAGDRAGLGGDGVPLPPGNSKWNQIEHRMFSFITMNWHGRPLVSYRAIVELISATGTKSLKLRADHDARSYERGIKVSDSELAAVPLQAHDWHGEWTYTYAPSAQSIGR